MKKAIRVGLVVTLLLGLAGASMARPAVWRVRQNYTSGGTGGYTNMIDYIEPAAAATNALFDGTTTNDTWNCWDVDTRAGSMGGYNYIQDVPVGSTGPEAQETLYDGTGSSNPITIKSTVNNGQHSPWYALPTSGPGFDQLLGNEHSAGINGNSQSSTYTVEISGLSTGRYLFYSYAHRLTSSFDRTDVPAGYYLTLNGGEETYVPRSHGLSEGDPGTGVLIPATVGEDGKLTIVYTQYAGFTGPAFQLAGPLPPPPPPPPRGTVMVVR